MTQAKNKRTSHLHKGWYTVLLAAMYLCMTTAGAQTRHNVDSVFNVSIQLSRTSKTDSAIVVAQKAIEYDSKRGDIYVFLANLYLRKDDFSQAEAMLKKALDNQYTREEYYVSLTNTLLRSKQYTRFLSEYTTINSHVQNKEDLFKKLLTAYSALKRYDEAVELIRNPKNKAWVEKSDIQNMYDDIILKRNKKIISAYFTNDWFNKSFKSQQLAWVGFSMPVSNNTLGLRLNYADRFSLTDWQLEADYYQKLVSRQYLYFNYGYGFKHDLFPVHRVGVEYYFSFMPKTEASIGGRYLSYSTSDVYILTASCGKYMGNHFVSIRPYYVLKNSFSKSSFTLLADYRLYGKSELNYWELELGYGSSPDDSYSTSQLGYNNRFSSYKIRIEKNLPITRYSDLHLVTAYAYEEYLLNTYRKRLTLEIGYKIRLR